MRLRLFETEWQPALRKLLTHPVTEVLALVAVVLLALWTIVATEVRLLHSPRAPVVFSPK